MSRKRRVVATLNITSLVDVALTLLVIFMIASPLIQHQIEISLPQTSAKELTEEESLVISVTDDGRVYLANKMIQPSDITNQLSEMRETRGLSIVSIRGDKDTNYGLIMEIMGYVRDAGIEDVGLVVLPKNNRR